MHRLLILSLTVLLTPACSREGGETAAADAQPDWTALNLALTDHHVIPRYAAFGEAGAALASQAQGFCPEPDAAALENLRGAFHEAMDAWQGIQHVQFGPITYFNWNFRLQFWPDDNNTGQRQLQTLIAAADPAALESANFARLSVGVQGFPALETLLFEQDSLAQLQADAYRCRVAETIAANIGGIAGEVHARWVDEFRATVAAADQRGFFESGEDATISFLKALIETMPRLRDQKLGEAVLGESPDRARLRRAESWRSARSLRNLEINVAALEEMFSGAPGQEVRVSALFLEQDVAPIRDNFRAVGAALDALPDGMAGLLESAEGHAALVELKAGVDALYEAQEAALKNTDLYLGFNSLDGD